MKNMEITRVLPFQGETVIETSNKEELSDPELKCPKCGRIGQNRIKRGVPVRGHPNVEETWLVCKCGHDLREITE